jgi:hypothetical protein
MKRTYRHRRQRALPSRPRRSSRSDAHRHAEASVEEQGSGRGHASATAERENSFGGKGRTTHRRPPLCYVAGAKGPEGRRPFLYSEPPSGAPARELLAERGKGRGGAGESRAAAAVVAIAVAGGALAGAGFLRGLGGRRLERTQQVKRKGRKGEPSRRRGGLRPSPAARRPRAIWSSPAAPAAIGQRG